jgi:prevent-host-death family protein
MARWQLQEAKARLSELVQSAQREGPQEITLRGTPAVVVVSKRDFDRMKKRKPSFIQFLRESPLAGSRLRVERNRSPVRDLAL